MKDLTTLKKLAEKIILEGLKTSGKRQTKEQRTFEQRLYDIVNTIQYVIDYSLWEDNLKEEEIQMRSISFEEHVKSIINRAEVLRK